MSTNSFDKGSKSLDLKKYFVTIENSHECFEIPMFASSLDDATLRSSHYEEAGFMVTRVRPEVSHHA